MPVIATALVGLFLLGGAFNAGAPAPDQTITPLPGISVHLTGYNAVSWQTDADPSVTASGAFSNPEVVAARSHDLADELPFGTVIEIDRPDVQNPAACGFDAVSSLIGYRVIADSMNMRMHNRVDILFPNTDSVSVGGQKINPSRALGVCDNVTVRILGRINPNKMPKTQDELVALLTKAGPSLAFASK